MLLCNLTSLFGSPDSESKESTCNSAKYQQPEDEFGPAHHKDEGDDMEMQMPALGSLGKIQRFAEGESVREASSVGDICSGMALLKWNTSLLPEGTTTPIRMGLGVQAHIHTPYW